MSCKIYLPSTLSEKDSPYVIAHEQAHIHRRDYLSKPLAFILLTVYWFNPLVWVAYLLFARDIELACDERVLQQHRDYKKSYSMALINCSVSAAHSHHAPLAFGETAVKARVKNILRYHPPKRFTILLCAVLVLTVTIAACAAPNPVQIQPSVPAAEEPEPEEVLDPFDWNSDTVRQTIIGRMKAEANAEGIISLKVWCAGDDKNLEEQLIKQFQERFADSGLTFNIRVQVKGAADTPDALLLANGKEADVFCIPGDQLPYLVSHEILAPVDSFYSDNVKAENLDTFVTAAKVNRQLYAYPRSQGNGCCLFYDKRVHDENDIQSMESLIQKAARQSKNVYFPLDNLWYSFSFFLTAGCDIHWNSDQQVQTMAIHTQKGLWALQSIRELCRYHHKGLITTSEELSGGIVSGFESGTLSAAVYGSFACASLRKSIGEENLGVAKLPTVVMHGEEKPLCSIDSHTMMGVHVHTQAPFAAQTLAYFLSREEAQQQRYTSTNTQIPTNQHLCDTEPCRSDPLLQAIQDQHPYTYPQSATVGAIAWSIGIQDLLKTAIVSDGEPDDTALQTALDEWALSMETQHGQGTASYVITDDRSDTSSETSAPPLSPIDFESEEIRQTIIERMKTEADEQGTITLSMWCDGEGKNTEEQLVNQFREYFADSGLTFNISVSVKGPSKVPSALHQENGSNADVFFFHGEWLPDLVTHGLIAKVDTFYQDNVQSETQPEPLLDAKVNKVLYAYPQSQGGYYLFYNKQVFDENDIQNMDTLIEKAASLHQAVYFPLENLWYSISFFITAGCDIHWDNDRQVQTMALQTQEGFWALQSIRDLCQYQSLGGSAGSADSPVTSFEKGAFSAMIYSASAYKSLRNAFQDTTEDLGIAKLPTVVIHGEEKQLCSLDQTVMMGVHAHCQAPFTAQTLAYFLSREDAQRQRYTNICTIPTNHALCNTEPCRSDPLLKAIQQQRPYTYPQGTTLGIKAFSLDIQDVIDKQWQTNGTMTDQEVLDALKKCCAEHQNDPSLLLGDTLPETVPSVIEQYHVPGEPFENIEYDTIVQLADMEYQILYGHLSDTELETTYQTMYRLIDANPLWTYSQKESCRNLIQTQQVSGTDTVTNQKTEEQKRTKAFYSIIPHNSIRWISDTYIEKTFLSPPEEYGTLEDLAPYLFDDTQPQVLHWEVLGEPFHTFYHHNSGFGDTTSFHYFLKGKNEWISTDLGPTYCKYDKASGKVYTQILLPDIPAS